MPIEQARKPEKRWSISNALRPIDIARKATKNTIKSASTTPTYPSSSPIMAKIKSVCASGRYSSFCTELPKPCPQSSPRPNAISDCVSRPRVRQSARYRSSQADCLTLGRTVRLLRAGEEEEAFAEAVDDAFALVVRRADGSREAVSSGEVSVRGLLGYV